MSKIITSVQEHMKMQQEDRCRAALKMIDVPDKVIWSLQGPILFQMAHLCCVIDQPMHWRQAIQWCWDHKGEIIHHAQEVDRLKKLELEEEFGQRPNTVTGTDEETNGGDVGREAEA